MMRLCLIKQAYAINKVQSNRKILLMKNQFRPVYIPCLALISADVLLVQAFLFIMYFILYIVYHICKDIQNVYFG